jgi:hypothetical protein
MSDRTPVPDDWQPECDNCRWILAHYDRDDCYLFEGEAFLSGEHVNPVVGAGWKEINNED